jgi:glucosylceramidase
MSDQIQKKQFGGTFMKKQVFTILLITFVFSIFCIVNGNESVEQKTKASLRTSTKTRLWQKMPDVSLFKGKNEDAEIVIDLKSQKQVIDGFGGCFNEKGWEALSLLTPGEREEVMKAFFDPVDGAKFNICRIPIGSSDYAISRYSLNESKDDFEMKNFSIDRDKKYLILYIKAAMKYKPDLRLWGSAWSPPSWMKTSNSIDGGSMKDDPRVYSAYALYLANFIKAYKKEGMDIFAVAVQNEPVIDRNYPTCLWEPQQFLVFIRDYMGPLFEKMNLKGKIMLGTMNDGQYGLYPKMVLDDPKANGYVSYVGYQWDGVHSVGETRRNHPTKTIMQTETECGNWHWRPGFDPDRPQNDENYAVYTWNKVKEYFDAGVNSYQLWNMVLDEEGKSIDSKKPWPQNAAVVIDRKTKKAVYTPMFFAFKHFSYYVKPGARYVDIADGGDNAVAFINPNGELVIVVKNITAKERMVNIRFGEYWLEAKLPEMSLNTIVVPKL